MFWSESFIPITEVPHMLPRRRGKKIAHSTIWRWVAKGVRGVHLEAWRLGGTYYTSPRALQEFGEKLSALTPPGREPHPSGTGSGRGRPRSETRRHRDVTNAEARLDAAGI